jgi:hypothetical protein
MSSSVPTPVTADAVDFTASHAEAGMRRALGLGDQPAAPQYGYRAPRTSEHQPRKRRFAVDGDVPVVMLERRGASATSTRTAPPPVDRLREIEADLRAEQNARRLAERQLNESRATIRDLQTKVGHTSLARDEALAAARSIQSDIVALNTALSVERDARLQAESAIRNASDSEGSVVRRRKAEALVVGFPEIPTGRRGRPPGSSSSAKRAHKSEPQPVRWW